MNETTESTSASAADALDAISTEGFRRQSFVQRFAINHGTTPGTLYAALLVVVTAVVVALFLLLKPNDPSRLRHAYPVAILLPGVVAEGSDELSLLAAAEPQKRGFESAWRVYLNVRETDEFPHTELYRFRLPRIRVDAWPPEFHAIYDQLENLYDRGIRYFIVTMSDTVLKLTADGQVWETFFEQHQSDPPVLIATVASAPLPGGADVSRGVIRNYIRSDDEANQFAAYIDSRSSGERAKEVFVVYTDDEYGLKAEELLLQKIKPTPSETIEIELARQSEENYFAELFDEQLRNEIDRDEDRYTFVILVGYGEMVVGMLDVLNEAERAHRNDGATRIEEVLVVSTMTEKAWQPEFYRDRRDQYLTRISTLAPFSAEISNDCESGVVCQFSYMTLEHVLSCTGSRSVSEFFDCFVESQKQARESGALNTEVSARGDSIVPLRVNVTETRIVSPEAAPIGSDAAPASGDATAIAPP